MLKRSRVLTLVMTLLCLAAPIHGDNKQTLVIGLGNFDPFFFENGDGGLFVELISAVFRLLPEYEVEYIYNLSNRRLAAELNGGRLDGAANIIHQNDIEGYISDPVFRFTDVAVSKKSRNIELKEVKDLRDYSLVTYQDASTFWKGVLPAPEEFKGRYSELPLADTLAKMVALGRADFTVLDIFVFLNTIQSWGDADYDPEDFDYHFLFPDNYSYMGFNDMELRDKFNTALASLRESGRYEAIYSNFLHHYGFKLKDDYSD